MKADAIEPDPEATDPKLLAIEAWRGDLDDLAHLADSIDDWRDTIKSMIAASDQPDPINALNQVRRALTKARTVTIEGRKVIERLDPRSAK